MGPVRQYREGDFSVTATFATELPAYALSRATPPVEFYDDVDPEVVRAIQRRADEVMADDDFELVDGYDDRK